MLSGVAPAGIERIGIGELSGIAVGRSKQQPDVISLGDGLGAQRHVDLGSTEQPTDGRFESKRLFDTEVDPGRIVSQQLLETIVGGQMVDDVG